MASPAQRKASPPIREFDLIRQLQRRHGAGNASILRGIGDDAAVIVPSRRAWQLLTTDLLTEGIHFDLRTATCFDIGFRAVAANLSDIAAMGGRPQYLLVAIAVPRSGSGREILQLYRGMMAACRSHKVRLIGGDTSASSSGWFVGITLIGSVPPGRALLRSGARVGDDIYVTGTLGDSLAGLALLEEARNGAATTSLPERHRRYLLRRHLHPTARIEEGHWLSARRWATAAIDVSDGLSGDLRHICEESGVGAEIDLAALPLSPALRTYAKSAGRDPVALALAGGEDYELLFTVPARDRPRFERMAAGRRLHAARIGAIGPARAGIRAVSPDGRRRPLPVTSYEHFRSGG